jgi:hypothetical protein
MTIPEDLPPFWDGDNSATVCAGSPRTHPDVPPIDLYLDVEEDEDVLDQLNDDGVVDDPGWLWRFGISEEESGFGEAQIDSGRAVDLEDAQRDCWLAVIAYLRSDGYSDDEIVASI